MSAASTICFETAMTGGNSPNGSLILRSQGPNKDISIAQGAITTIVRVEGDTRSDFAKVISDSTLRLQ